MSRSQKSIDAERDRTAAQQQVTLVGGHLEQAKRIVDALAAAAAGVLLDRLQGHYDASVKS